MKHGKLKIVLLAALCALTMSMVALTGCAGSQGTLSSDINDETGAYVVTAENAGKGSALGMSGGLVIEEGQVLMMSPVLEKGALQVTLSDETGTVLFNEEASGKVLSTYTVDPGNYGVGISCKTDGTTGTLLIVGIDPADFEKQDKVLEDLLAESGIALSDLSAASTAASASTSANAEAAEASSEAADAASSEAAEGTAFEVDYGTSELYSEDDIYAAIEVVMDEFTTWKGAQMQSIAYISDETSSSDVEYCNELREAKTPDEPEFDQAIVLTSSFHSPSGEDAEGTSWEPDTDYTDWTWHLGRSDGGEWKLMSWGF